MREYLSTTAGTVVAVVLAFVVIGGLSYGSYAFFAPRYMHVQNQVFHESQQYNDGMNVELEHYRESFALCNDKPCKDSIRSIVVEEYATYPESKLNPDLMPFLEQMRSGQ